jgi:signal transduction histidine kinase
MGARTLEAKLTGRLFGVVAPALGLVGAASVALTWTSLDAADTTEARRLAEETSSAMRSELNEPDPFELAASQVIEAMDDIEASVLVSNPRTEQVFETRAHVPRELASIAAGTCESAEASGKRWRACAVAEPYVGVVAAIDTSAHARVVRRVAEGVALVILLTLGLLALAVRSSLIGALTSVRALVAWSDRVVSGDDASPAPIADTGELARLGAAFDAVVKHLTLAVARARATSENIAHELRSPLTAIRAELDVLAAGDAPAAVAATTQRLRGDVERLTRVIDAILVLAVPQATSSPATDCIVNLADVARELAPAGTQVDAPDEALVVGDRRLVELAITNLLENARKHTGREARSIRVERSDGTLRVAIVDDGPGLSDEARARMFDRYWRGSESGGTGLGLALVRAVAKRHGGDADARPNAWGRGLEVAVTFGNVVGWHEEK